MQKQYGRGLFKHNIISGHISLCWTSQHFPTAMQAVVNSYKFDIFLMAFIAQYVIGFIMQIVEPGKQSGYSIKAYQAGFGFFGLLLFVM